MNPTNGRILTAVTLAVALFIGTSVSQFSFARATNIEVQDLDTEPPVNTVQSLLDTHDAIVASIESTSDVPDEFNVRWTQPGTVEGGNGVSLFVVDCLPGEYPGDEQFMLAEDVRIFQKYTIGSGSDYLSVLFLVVNEGKEDQVVKLGTICIDEDGNESGDNDNDGSDITVNNINNNNNVYVTNIANIVVNHIHKNVTVINNSTNNTVIVTPPVDNGTDTGGNTTDPGTGGNTTDGGGGGGVGNGTDTGGGGTGSNTTAPTTGGETGGGVNQEVNQTATQQQSLAAQPEEGNDISDPGTTGGTGQLQPGEAQQDHEDRMAAEGRTDEMNSNIAAEEELQQEQEQQQQQEEPQEESSEEEQTEESEEPTTTEESSSVDATDSDQDDDGAAAQ